MCHPVQFRRHKLWWDVSMRVKFMSAIYGMFEGFASIPVNPVFVLIIEFRYSSIPFHCFIFLCNKTKEQL